MPLAADLQGDFGALNEHAPAQAVLGTQRSIDLGQGIHLHAGQNLSVCGLEERGREVRRQRQHPSILQAAPAGAAHGQHVWAAGQLLSYKGLVDEASSSGTACWCLNMHQTAGLGMPVALVVSLKDRCPSCCQTACFAGCILCRGALVMRQH